ncbi:MAG: hypothetical protein LJF04_10710 [Gemmatimonadetes bacterium]|nr:hypothetical protein [Gemmatimonadota bacterium]
MPFRRLLATSALILTFVTLGGRSPVSAQMTARDSAAVLLGTAERFEQRGRADVADALYRYIAEHFAATPAAAQARARVRRASPAGSAVQGSGRVELQVWSTLYGLWLGVAVPGALGVDGPEPYGVGLLIGGPAGFLAGKGIARSRQITEGQARAITLGGSWGTWQGLGWTDVFDIGEGYTCDVDLCTDDGATEERFAGMIVGGLAGIGVGTVLSRRDISAGAATTVNFGALWGTWFGVAGGYLMDLEGDNLLAATLLGGDAGLLGAALMAPKWRMSRSHARLVSIYGVMGGLAGLGVDLIVQPDNDKAAMAVPLVGSIVGLMVGAGVTRDYDRPETPGPVEDLPGSALVRVRDGRVGMALPLPTPRRVTLEGARGRGTRTALGLTLLEMRFR